MTKPVFTEKDFSAGGKLREANAWEWAALVSNARLAPLMAALEALNVDDVNSGTALYIMVQRYKDVLAEYRKLVSPEVKL